MVLVKTKKRRKEGRMYGRNMGTHGGGARKKRKGSGHRGGKGMSGTGKRADHKKTLITKLYGNDYFGKSGVTSKKTEKDKRKRIQVSFIDDNVFGYLKKGLAKETKEGIEIEFKEYKLLGKGPVKNKLVLKVKEASKGAIEAIEKSGGKVLLEEKENTSKNWALLKKSSGKIS